MHESHQAMKYFIKFKQLAAHVQWVMRTCRQAYNGLAKHIKDDMVHHAKLTTLAGLQKLVQAINVQYWEQKGELSMKPELLDLLEISLNQILTLTGLTTSPAKVLPIPSRTTTTLALPGQGLNF